MKISKGPARWGSLKRESLLLTVYLLGTLAFTEKATAQSKTEIRSALTSGALKEERARHRVYGQLRIEGMKYFTEIPETPQLTYSQFLSGQLSYVGETSWLENAADMAAGTFFSQNQSHLVMRELYTSPRTQGYRVYLGRKKNLWSEMDDQWDLGLWQPYFEQDALRPEKQGLTGLFLDLNSQPQWGFLAMVTPIFVPTLGPDIREEEGALVADSRWYHAPSRQANVLNNKPTPITYKLSIPEAAKLAAHGGYAFMGRAGNKDRGLWAVSSYGYLPVNRLVLKRNVKFQIHEDLGVIVSPDVNYHSVFSADVGYTRGNARLALSFLQDKPEEKLPATDWVIQKLYPVRAYDAGMEWTIPNFFTRSISLQVHYLRVEGGEIEDIGSDGAVDVLNLFDQRVKFRDAVNVKVQGELARIYRRPLEMKFSYLYDQEQKGSMINTEFMFYPKQELAFLLGADFLGTENDTSKVSGFLNQYRANDRVYGGMTYVF